MANETKRAKAVKAAAKMLATLEEHAWDAEKEGHTELTSVLTPIIDALRQARNIGKLPTKDGLLHVTINLAEVK